MPRIDYDGIQYARDNEIHVSEARMLDALQDAMRDDEVPTMSLVYVWVICDYCRGNGGHSNHMGVISNDKWNDWDDDERDDYLCGRYDTNCDKCDGTGKVRELNLADMPSEIGEWIERYRADYYESAQVSYYERLAGC